MLVPDTAENLKRCICSDCPTYGYVKDAAEGLFCAREKGAVTIEEEECLCDQCPIDREYKLTARLDLMEKKILKMNQYYCHRGPAGTKR